MAYVILDIKLGDAGYMTDGNAAEVASFRIGGRPWGLAE
jgi:hypothetical protein